MCVNFLVEIISPMQGAIYGGPSSARLTARVTQWDGGAYTGASIPASATLGVTAPAALLRTDAGFAGDFDLPPTGGTHTLTAGWDGGANDSVEVTTEVCGVVCPDWQECLPNAAGGICRDLGLTLTWNQPTEDFKFASSSTVPLSLSVTRADAGAFTKPVPFTVSGGDGGTLVLLGGAWTASIQSGTVDARRTLEAGWADGGPVHPVRHFLVDVTPASLSLVVASDGGAFQRDAVIPAVLTSNEPLVDAGVLLGGIVVPRVPTASCPNYGATTGAAGCFLLDFSQPALNALDGGFPTVLSATDGYGNSGSNAGAVLPVTRVRWQQVVTRTDQLRAALALGADGTVYVGGDETATKGHLFALSPAGVTKAGWPDGGVELGSIQSIAVAGTDAGEVVFYAANNASGGAIGGRLAGDGGPGPLRGECLASGSTSRTYSGLGLARYNNTSEVVAAGAAGNGADAFPAAYRVDAPCVVPGGSAVPNLSAPEVPLETRSATNVAIDGTTAYFIGRGARVFSSTLTTVWSAPTSLARPSSAASTSVLTGSALHQTLNAGGWQLAASGWTIPGGMHLVPLSGAMVSSISTGNEPVGMPALLYRTGSEAGFIYAGVAGATPNISRFSVNPAAVAAGPNTTALASSAPVLGAGTNRLGYVVDGSGLLTVFQSLATTVSWQAAIPGGGAVSSPTLDCVRDASGAGIAGARVGVLYVALNSTSVTEGTVTALIVDSPKLDDAQYAWPKYQRTAGNAGNTDTTFALNPGCPP